MVTLENEVRKGFLQSLYRHGRRAVMPMAAALTLSPVSLFFSGCGGKSTNPTSSHEEPKKEQPQRPGGNPTTPYNPNYGPITPESVGLAGNNLYQKVTDNNGSVTFKEPGNSDDIVINVQNSNGIPVEGVEIEYTDGINSEVFEGRKDGYLPIMGIFGHNSPHTLVTDNTNRGILHLQTVDDLDEVRAMIVFDRTRLFPERIEYVYHGTITEDERLEQYNQQLAVARLFDLGAKALGGKVEIEIFGIELPLSLEKLTPMLSPQSLERIGGKSARYDLYRITNKKTFQGRTVEQDVIEIFPTNVPQVAIDPARVENGNLIMSWKGTDEETYEKIFPGLEGIDSRISRTDATILLGRTRGSDLDFDFRLYHEGKLIAAQNNSQFIGLKKENPKPGEYKLEVDVRDEIENQSSSYLEFKIAESSSDNGSSGNNSQYTTFNGIKFPLKFNSEELDTIFNLPNNTIRTSDTYLYSIRNFVSATAAGYNNIDGMYVLHFSNPVTAGAEHADAIKRGNENAAKYGIITTGPNKITLAQSSLLSSYDGHWFFDANDNPDKFGIVFRIGPNTYNLVYDGIPVTWTTDQAFNKGVTYAEEIIRLNR